MAETETDTWDGDGDGEPDPDPTDLSDLLVPIAGLLSILFAVMAGASLSLALEGPPSGYLVPVGLAAASVGSIYTKRRLQAAVDEDADA